MQKEIRHLVMLNKTPDEVWAFLTTPELIELWLMKNDFKPEVGHEFQFVARPIPQMDFDGIINCKVLEVVPNKKLVYTWKGGPGNGVINLDSVVTWTLEPKDGGTALQIVHTGFNTDLNPMMYMAMNDGWLKNMNKIDTLETQKK